MVTLAFGTSAPVGSLTTPWTLPIRACAKTVEVSGSSKPQIIALLINCLNIIASLQNPMKQSARGNTRPPRRVAAASAWILRAVKITTRRVGGSSWLAVVRDQRPGWWSVKADLREGPSLLAVEFAPADRSAAARFEWCWSSGAVGRWGSRCNQTCSPKDFGFVRYRCGQRRSNATVKRDRDGARPRR